MLLFGEAIHFGCVGRQDLRNFGSHGFAHMPIDGDPSAPTTGTRGQGKASQKLRKQRKAECVPVARWRRARTSEDRRPAVSLAAPSPLRMPLRPRLDDAVRHCRCLRMLAIARQGRADISAAMRHGGSHGGAKRSPHDAWPNRFPRPRGLVIIVLRSDQLGQVGHSPIATVPATGRHRPAIVVEPKAPLFTSAVGSASRGSSGRLGVHRLCRQE